MKIRIISSCSALKSFTPPNLSDLLSFEEIQRVRNGDFISKVDQLPKIKSKKLYTGRQHLYLMEGILNSKHEIDLFIISAGYGVVSGEDLLYPYEATFSGMGKKELTKKSEILNIPGMIDEIISDYTDITLVLLGKSYLEASSFKKSPYSRFSYFLTAASAVNLVPKGSLAVTLGNKDAKLYGAPLVSLKGKLAAKFLDFLNSVDSPVDLPVSKDKFLESIK